MKTAIVLKEFWVPWCNYRRKTFMERELQVVVLCYIQICWCNVLR